MRAVICDGYGGVDVLGWAEVDDPVAGPGEVLIDVAAAGVNRADLLQRMGLYPPPPGASDLIGLECSGVVAAIGRGVTGWAVGDACCALMAGGGYAEKVAVPAGQVMPVPAGVRVEDAAALPEVACTVWSTVVQAAGLTAGSSLLVHGGSSGIGTFAIQLARALGAGPILATVGSAEKAAVVVGLGATAAIEYRTEDFVERSRELTGGAGVDVILDVMGASYLARNLTALAYDGRLAIIGMQGGIAAELDLMALVHGRKRVIGTSLRARPAEQKAAICAAVVESVWPLVEAGAIRPVVHERLPMAQAGRAHELVESSAHIGKVLLLPGA